MLMPLSASQQEVMNLGKVIGNEGNTLAVCAFFRGAADGALLTESVRWALEQDPMLRTRIDAQRMAQVVGLPMPDVQLMTFPSMEAFQRWKADAQHALPMNPEEECVQITPVLIQSGGGQQARCGVLLRLHHVAADGWAAALILKRIEAHYHALCKGENPPALPIVSYERFVQAEQAHFQSARSRREAGFWRELLHNHAQGQLLSSKANGSFSAKRLVCELPKELFKGLEQAALQKHRTVLSILFSAVAVAYARMEEARDFSIGTLLLNRTTEELNMVGNCFTTIPFPVTIGEDDTFATLNDQISNGLFAVLRRQRTTYSRIVEQAFDEPLRRPLFDTLVNYQDYSGEEYAGMDFDWLPPACQLEALQINAVITGEQFRIHYDYRSDCLAERKVKELHARLTAALEDVLSGGWEKAVTMVSQQPACERARIAAWNQTAHPYPCQDTLISLFEKQAAQRGGQAALMFRGEEVSYHAFRTGTRRLAGYLQHCGVRPGQIVGIRTDRSIEMMLGIYAILYCGAAYMPIGTDVPEERMRFMLQDSESACLLTQSWQRAEAPAGVLRIDLDKPLPEGDFDYASPATQPEDKAYVIYTSGSTGTPKGVMIAHRSIVDRIHWMNRTFGMTENDRVLQKTPYTFDVSVWELFWWAGYGGTLVILEPDAHKDPGMMIQAINRYQITKMHFVPSMLAAFLAYTEALEAVPQMNSLQQVFASGEALMPAHVQKFYRLFQGAELINLYGPTECTVDVTCFRCSREERASIPIGKPVDNTQLYILDRHLQPVPLGAAGELCVGGNLVGIGYLNRPELTQERFVANPFGDGRLYRTGDLTCWNEHGEVEYMGRMDFQVKLRGQRLELGEIERCMTRIPGIKEAAVLVQQIDENDATLVGYYTGVEMPSGQLQQALRRSLPDYMVPSGFLRMDAMPLTTSGKLDRKRLALVPVEVVPAAKDDQPRSPLEARLCAAFARALSLKDNQVGYTFDFFAQGGTSLQAILLLTELFQEHHLQLKDIYNHPTPGELAAFLSGGTVPDQPTPDDYSQEAPFLHVDTAPIERAHIPEGKKIFITGATGFLGVHLLQTLLHRYPERKFICLVRNAEKLQRHWAYIFPGEAYPEYRIQPLPGDLTQNRFGLSQPAYESLVSQVGCAFHSAADVRHFGQWESSYAVNTQGTQQVIQLCLAADAPLHHVSTMSVDGFILTTMGEQLSATFDEGNLFIGQRFRENVYVHSKYLAEREILQARNQGLKANIYRVGNLLWRQSDGMFQQNREAHDFYMLSHAFMDLGADVDKFASLAFDLTAVDQCALAICLLAEGNLGQIWHMMNPNQVTLHGYLCALTGKALPSLPYGDFMQLLQQHADDPRFGFLLAYAAANEQNDISTFAEQQCSRTAEALRHAGFVWEKPTAAYMRYVL